MKLLAGNSNRPLAEAISAQLAVPLIKANIRRFALTLGLHTLEDRLRVLLRQIRAAQSHIDDLNAQAFRLFIHIITNAMHQPCAIGTNHS